MNWYYESAGQQQGPVTEAGLDRLLAEGKITLETLVWREGMSGWTPLRAAKPVAPSPTAPICPGLETPSPAPAIPSPAAGSDVPQPGWIRCSLTGRYYPPSEIIYFEGKPYCAAAKPQVVAAMQSGGVLPTLDAGREGPAWEKRSELGALPAILATIKSVLLKPQATFAAMKREGGLQTPLMYYLSMGTAVAIVGQGLAVLVRLTGIGASGVASARSIGFMVGSTVGGIVFAPVRVLLAAFINAGLTHLSLMLVKGANRPFETTFRSISYINGSLAPVNLIYVLLGAFAGLGSGALVRSGSIGAIGPIFGAIMLPLVIWYFYLGTVALSASHETSRGKAAAAVLLPAVVCCGSIAIIAIGFFAWSYKSVSH
jgi:hypothetical protein